MSVVAIAVHNQQQLTRGAVARPRGVAGSVRTFIGPAEGAVLVIIGTEDGAPVIDFYLDIN